MQNRNTTEYRINSLSVGECVRLASLETAIDLETSPDGEFEVVSTSERTVSVARPMSMAGIDSNLLSRKSVSVTAPLEPQNTAFQVYVPFVKGTEVSFEVEVEDVGTGRGTVMGVCTFALEDVPEQALTAVLPATRGGGAAYREQGTM